MLDFYVKTRIRFSLRDKRLFEITKVEIMRVDCISMSRKDFNIYISLSINIWFKRYFIQLSFSTNIQSTICMKRIWLKASGLYRPFPVTINHQHLLLRHDNFLMQSLSYFLYLKLQDLSASESHKLDVPDEVVKISALLKVFCTVIRSLGEDFMPSKSRLFTVEYMMEVRQEKWCDWFILSPPVKESE